MARLVEFDVGNGQSVLIEVEDVQSDEVKPVSKRPGKIAAQAKQTFDQALDNLKPMVERIRDRVDGMTQPADEVEVKFSVKLSGEIGAVVTKVGGEATYEITLKWQHK